MRKLLLVTCCLILISSSFAQSIGQKLQTAFQQFEADSQLRHAIASLYVIDAATGEVVFDKNSQIGLAPASTQKIITSVTAFELLGRGYRYKTEFFNRRNNVSSLDIIPSGDPTFGSWRWKQTSVDSIISNLMISINNKKINTIKAVFVDNSGWDSEGIPSGWIWQDIGNYYGAGAHKFNFRENQYDIILRSGKNIGDSVSIVTVEPGETEKIKELVSKVVSAGKGSGDNAYVYLTDKKEGKDIIRGTIPLNEDRFKISASMTEPEEFFLVPLLFRLDKEKHFDIVHGEVEILDAKIYDSINSRLVYTHYSPSLDSIIYWFNKRSINLYGEALVKTFAYEKTGFASTDSGTSIVRNFWKEKGLDQEELNIYDGSGLSPLNRVTTHAQVEVLKYAKTKEWYPYFYDALPEFNGMKVKSGTISDVKGFCGYHKSKEGKEYIFSFLVNNYSGRSSQLVSKMYKVMDLLK